MRYKKFFVIISVLFGLYACSVYIYFSTRPLVNDYCPITMPDEKSFSLYDAAYPNHEFKTINDASCLNKTRVYDIIKVKSVDDIKNALLLAREKNIPISIAGVRHSMGGQAFYTDAIILDMTHFNSIVALDEKHKLLTVHTGATWHDIQLFLHAKNLSVKAMQSTDIFTVGGSLSVNAHGMDHNAGSIASTVESFSIMLADGSIQKVTSQDQPELFNAVIGGYGLFGIILEVTLQVTDNVMYKRDIIFLDYHEFPQFFEEAVKQGTYGLLYAHLSTSPISFFHDMIVYGYKEIPYEGVFEPLGTVSLVNIKRFLINLAKKRTYAQFLKWVAEKYIDPAIDETRKKTTISRNGVMHDSVEYLENIIVNETDILQEYFIPKQHFVACVQQMGEILKRSTVPVLNASVRFVHKEEIMLNYAPEDMFAIVLYLNQKVNKKALEQMKVLTQKLIDLVLTFNGTFFLPYQLSYSKDQLQRAYPDIDRFFTLKRAYDPGVLFMNNFYAKFVQ